MAPSADIGDRHAVFQPCHGTAPDIMGQGKANPTGMILSTAMLLEWLGVRHKKPSCIEGARAIEAAVDAALLDDSVRTADLGGRGGTQSFGDAVAARVRAGHAIAGTPA